MNATKTESYDDQDAWLVGGGRVHDLVGAPQAPEAGSMQAMAGLKRSPASHLGRALGWGLPFLGAAAEPRRHSGN